jgi:hypothetical protein
MLDNMVSFKINNKAYLTDKETLDVLRGVAPAAKKSKSTSAVEYIMALGLITGRIAEFVSD